MTTVVDLPVATLTTPDPQCRECRYGDCRFSKGRVWLYLTIRQAARAAGEPFDLVYRSEVRESRLIDPNVRGARTDPDELRAIGYSLDALERTHGRRFLHPMNALAVATALCPERCREDES